MAQRKPFLLRIAPDVRAALQRWTDDELRSLNGQIEYVLRQALQKAGRLKRGPEQLVADDGEGSPAAAPETESE
ncbi:MAG TPA: hypothetical protein PKC45_03750 [Gemmatales bacterium]|nr:hypothetical protein [Gemmatales bacterium]